MNFIIPAYKPSFTINELLESILNSSEDDILSLNETVSNHLKCDYVIPVSKGRTGLDLIIKALKLNGKNIVTPAYTCLVVPNTLFYNKCIMTFIDVDIKTYNLSVEDLLKKNTNKIKAIIPTHLFGLPSELDDIKKISEKNNCFIIEDAALALGAKYKNDFVGTIGDAGFFSFDMYKSIGAIEGGMIVTNDKKLVINIKKKLLNFHDSSNFIKYNRFLRGLCFNYITYNKYNYNMAVSMAHFIKLINPSISLSGVSKLEKNNLLIPSLYNENLTYFQARLIAKQFKKINYINEERLKVANEYNKLLKNNKDIKIPLQYKGRVYSCYPIYVDFISNEFIAREMKLRGVEVVVFFPYVVHSNPCIQSIYGYTYNCPNSQKAAQTLFGLPIYPGMDKKDIKYVSEKIIEVVELYKKKKHSL